LLALLRVFARHGRFLLVAGLVAGLALPQAALSLRPWLGEMVLILLFLNAVRIGLPSAARGLKHLRKTVYVVLAYQLVLPLVFIGIASALGFGQSPVSVALTLMLAAPSVTASPNMSAMLGHPPEIAFRLLILGTLILPLTVIPIFWVSPALGDWQTAVGTSLRLGAAICGTVALGFGVRAYVLPQMDTQAVQALDGLTSFALAVIVIGLMSAVAPALTTKPVVFAGWMLCAISINIGMQVLAYLILRRLGYGDSVVPFALVAGNRNVALFLIGASAIETETFLIFLGCYQFPMYLTPIVMRPLFKRRNEAPMLD